MSTYKIGLWGTAQAGKTTYLAMLYQAFLENADLWEIYADDASRQFVENAYEQIYKDRIFPDKTVKETSFNYTIIVHKNLHLPEGIIPAGTEFTLHFEDAAGELYEAYYDRDLREQKLTVEQRSTIYDVTSNRPIDLFSYLAECRALMILIDPARTTIDAGHHELEGDKVFVPQQGSGYNHQRTYRELLFQLYEDLRQHHRMNHSEMPYSAFCLMKADANDHLWQARYQADEFWPKSVKLEENSEMATVQKHLGNVFFEKQLPGLVPIERVRGFLVSAIGRQQDNQPNISTGHTWQRPQTPRPAVYNHSVSHFDLPSVMNQATIFPTYHPQSIFDPNEIRPHNLIQPILWLVQRGINASRN